jgi:NADPH:quinone reductase
MAVKSGLSAYKAVVMRRYGGPQELRCEVVSPPPLSGDDIRVKVEAAAVNHTDLKIRAGVWPVFREHPFPYVPGVEAVGVVTEVGPSVSTFKIGDAAITMMQGMGGVSAVRQGGYAEYVSAPAQNFAKIGSNISLLDIATLGLAGITAYFGFAKICPLEGKDILVTGAAGGVGSAAVAIASALGAHVTGVVSRPTTINYVRSLGAEHVLCETMPSAASFDGVLDTVAGPLFSSCVNALKANGSYSMVGAVAGAEVTFDAWDLIKPVRLTGYSSENLTGEQLQQAIDVLTALMKKGQLKVPLREMFKLDNADEAHAHLEAGGNRGRVLLIP